jgi:hypothetical protein
MKDLSVRIASLKRYVTLLRQEERRLKEISKSHRSSELQRIEAAGSLMVITSKLSSAERELSQLELGGKRREIM